MPFLPSFSVTPKEPFYAYQYDSDIKKWSIYAELRCFGVLHGTYFPWRLIDQNIQDKSVLSHNPLLEPLPPTLPEGWYRYSMAWLSFVTDATDTQQCHIKYDIASLGYPPPKVAIYINGELEPRATTEVHGIDKIGILFECPGPQIWTGVYMFLVRRGTLELLKISCDIY